MYSWKQLLLLICLSLPGISLPGQPIRDCATDTYNAQQNAADPSVRQRRQAIETFTRERLALRSSNGPGLITIPVVVHVVHATGIQNISQAQIASQIRILNEDFRRMNADRTNTPSVFEPVAADVQVEFCLASVDPDGNPTNGITRTATINFWGFSVGNDFVKSTANGGKDPWPTDQYLNIWVCNLSGSTLGYAQFPGGPPETDGVVVDYEYFGDQGTAVPPFNQGRTTTHEVGHYLNLRHIWGDGDCTVDDFVDDTPSAGDPNYSSAPCAFPGPNTCDTGAGDLADMFMNYMDYSDDGCMNLFTIGQKDRMRVLFEPGGPRHSLLLSPAACAPMPASCFDGILNGDELATDCGGPCGLCDCVAGPLQLELQLDDYPEENAWTITNAAGEVVAQGGPYEQANQLIEETLNLPPGDYTFFLTDSFNDGICCAFGDGYVELSAADGTLLLSDGDFGSNAFASFCVQDANCPFTLALQEGPIPSGTYVAADLIEASAAVAPAAEVLLEGEMVTLKPGFSVPNGALFTALASPAACTFGEGAPSLLGAATGSSRAVPSAAVRKPIPQPDLTVFPNPSSGNVQVVWAAPETGRYSLRITTLLGQVVYEQHLSEHLQAGQQQQLPVEVKRFGAGVYLVTLQGPTSRVTRRLLVQ